LFASIMAGARPMLMLLVLVPGAAALHIVFGAHNIPHPGKAGTGGEDAFFFDDSLGTFGVADGVGGSAREGVDPGAFSRELLRRCYQSASMGGFGNMPKLSDALSLVAAAPIDLGGSTTLLLGQLVAGTDELRLINLGDCGAMLLRPSLRKFGEHQVQYPRCVLRTQYQSHFFNCPYSAAATRMSEIAKSDELATTVQDGDVLIAASDGVFDNMFDKDLQASVSEQLAILAGDDAYAAQQAVTRLAKSIAEDAHDIGLRNGEQGLDTPFAQEAAEDDYPFRGGGKMDDIAIVVGVVRKGERPPALKLVHNFNGAMVDTVWLQPPDTRGVVVPTAQKPVQQTAAHGNVAPTSVQLPQAQPGTYHWPETARGRVVPTQHQYTGTNPLVPSAMHGNALF